MNDHDLREQLERRTTSAPLASTERVGLLEAVHARTSKRDTRVSTWSRRLAIPMAAAGTVIVFVLAVGFPRLPQTASNSPTPGSSPYETSSPVASESTSPSPPPQSGLAVLSADQLIAMAADPSKIGQVVVSDAVIDFVPSPTQFDVPDASPQAMGTIGSIVVMGESFPNTDWPVHAFRILDGGRLLYLGAVNDRTSNGLWTVPDAIAAAPPEAASVLSAVQGWLLLTAAAPCAAPLDFESSQDYWCGGSWLLPAQPDPPTEGTLQLVFPNGIHVQRSAYQDFAGNPQGGAGLGGEPRLGTYLIRPAGCPPNVMGDCPVWEMVGRLEPATAGAVPTPDPAATPTAETTPGLTDSPTAPPPPAPTPTAGGPAATPPDDWPAGLRDALAQTAFSFVDSTGDAPIFRLSLWPFDREHAFSLPDGFVPYGSGGDYSLVVHRTTDMEVWVVHAGDWVMRQLGSFPMSLNNEAVIDRQGTTVYMSGSGGDSGTTGCPGCVDYGVVAWDVEAGDQRIVVPAEAEVGWRGTLVVSPSGGTVVSATADASGVWRGYEVVTGGTTELLPGTPQVQYSLDIDAITDAYALGYGSINKADSYIMVDLVDGSGRAVPPKLNGDPPVPCDACLSIGRGPQSVLDDSRFLLSSTYQERFEIYTLDADTNKAKGVYGWDTNGDQTRDASHLGLYYEQPVLSAPWILLSWTPAVGERDLSALNVDDGTLIELGLAK